MEYTINNAIHKLSIAFKPKVAFIDGQHELDSLHTVGATKALEEYYEVHRVIIGNRLRSLKDYQAIIIAKPDSGFDEKDKFIIDQFIMHGGKVFWLIDPSLLLLDSPKSAMA